MWRCRGRSVFRPMTTNTIEIDEIEVSDPPPKKESFVKHAAVYGLGTLATQAISILLLPLYAQMLPVADFGAVSIIKKIGDVIQRCLMVDGIRQATLNFWGTGERESRATIAATVSFFVYLSWIVSTALLLAFAKPLSSYFSMAETPYVLPVGVIVFMFSATAFMPLALMQARLESIQFVAATLSIALIQFLVIFVTVAYWGWGVWGVIAGMAVANAGIGIPLTLRELILARQILPDLGQLKELILFSLPFIPTGLFFFILMGGDQLFLARIAGTEIVGIYSMGHRIATVVSLVAITPLTQVWSAWIYTAYKEENAATLLGTAITRIMLVYITATLGLALLKSEILTLLRAAEYMDAIHVITPIAVAYFFMIFANLMDVSLWVTRRTKRKAVIAACSATFMAAVYYVLIPIYHRQGAAEMGAAYGTVIGLIGHALFTYLGTRRVFAVKFELGRLVLGGALAAIFCLLGNSLGDGLRLIPFKLVIFITWLIAIWFGGLLTMEEKALAIQNVRDFQGRLLSSWKRS